jgi:hypothetical protein
MRARLSLFRVACLLFVGASVVPIEACPGAAIEVDVREFGAKGDGVHDDGPALRAAIASARERAGPVVIRVPAGEWAYRGRIDFVGTSLRGAGMDATRLLALDAADSALILRGRDVSMAGFTVAGVRAPRERSRADVAAGILVQGARGFSIRGVRVVHTASVGMMINDSSGSSSEQAYIADCHVAATMADGIHITNGSRYITVTRNFVHGTGDDAIAVVSYRRNHTVCGDIDIASNAVGWNSHGRGLAVAGGERVAIVGNAIERTAGAGVYVAAERSYDTYGVRDVVVLANRIFAPVRAAGLWHGGVHVSGRDVSPERAEAHDTVERVRIAGNVIEDAPRAGIALLHGAREAVLADNAVVRSRGERVRIGPGARAVRAEGEGVRDGSVATDRSGEAGRP